MLPTRMTFLIGNWEIFATYLDFKMDRSSKKYIQKEMDFLNNCGSRHQPALPGRASRSPRAMKVARILAFLALRPPADALEGRVRHEEMRGQARSGKLDRARFRLYRSQILQVNTRWKALAEIYTMHSFAPFSHLNFFVKNRQFFATELMKIH